MPIDTTTPAFCLRCVSGLRISTRATGQSAETAPHGLQRVTLTFGSFSVATIAQIRQASEEDVGLARALVASIPADVDIDLGEQDREGWLVKDGAFRIISTIRHPEGMDTDTAVTKTCREVIVPIMGRPGRNLSATIWSTKVLTTRPTRGPSSSTISGTSGTRGTGCSVSVSTVSSARHAAWSRGGAMAMPPDRSSKSTTWRHFRCWPYDPATDLVPLCPNCHRAVHTRRPAPIPIGELRAMLEAPIV